MKKLILKYKQDDIHQQPQSEPQGSSLEADEPMKDMF